MNTETTLNSIRTAVEDFQFGKNGIMDSSKREYASKLKTLVEWAEKNGMELKDFKQKQVRQFQSDLKERTNPKTGTPITDRTLLGYAKVIKTFLSWLSIEEDYEEIVSPTQYRKVEMPTLAEEVMELYTPKQIADMLKSCKNERTTSLQVRNEAIISVLIDTGIRADELTKLQIRDVHFSPQGNEHYLLIHGKGRKEREVPLGEKAATILRRYIKRHRGNSREEAVFLSVKGGGLQYQGLDHLIDKIAENVGITGQTRKIHRFRHTFAVRFLENGGEIKTLSILMGHASVTTTEIYLKALKSTSVRKNAISVLDALAS